MDQGAEGSFVDAVGLTPMDWLEQGGFGDLVGAFEELELHTIVGARGSTKGNGVIAKNGLDDDHGDYDGDDGEYYFKVYFLEEEETGTEEG